MYAQCSNDSLVAQLLSDFSEIKNAIAKEIIIKEVKKLLVIQQHIENFQIGVNYSEEEMDKLLEQYCLSKGIKNSADLNRYLDFHKISKEKLRATVVYNHQIEVLKHKIISDTEVVETFLEQKLHEDLVTFELYKFNNPENAQIAYDKMNNNSDEAYESQTIGPIPLKSLHPVIKNILLSAMPDKVNKPVQIENEHFIVRLKSITKLQINDIIKNNIRNELFAKWLENQISLLP